MCFGCSKEPSHRDGSFEYPQHMFWTRNEENSFQYALLSGGLIYNNVYNRTSLTPFITQPPIYGIIVVFLLCHESGNYCPGNSIYTVISWLFVE